MLKIEKEVRELREVLANKDAQITLLQEQLKQLLHKRYAASSEKIPPNQLALFDEAEQIEAEASLEDDSSENQVEVKSHTRQRKPRVSVPADLPREDIVYDLSEDEKVCPHDGTPLKAIGSDDHEQLEIIPAKIKVICHKRLKYACPCCEAHIVTAKKPKQPIEKSIASPSLLAFVATQKYADALPLYRQSGMFKRVGIELDRSNLANWMVKCGQLVQPLINLLREHQRQQAVIYMDESPVQVLEEPGKTAQSLSYMWVMASRGRDGKEAQSIQPKGKVGKADQGLAYIQKLYAIEKSIKDEPPDVRHQIRQAEAVPIFNKMRAWLDKSLLTMLPKSQLGKALAYLNNQWPRLIAYLDDGHYPIDNNAAERAIRPFTIGRKNWIFSKSQAGAKASANLYSLVETAKANDLNVFDTCHGFSRTASGAES